MKSWTAIPVSELQSELSSCPLWWLGGFVTICVSVSFELWLLWIWSGLGSQQPNQGGGGSFAVTALVKMGSKVSTAKPAVHAQYKYHLLVVGGGPGGLAAAKRVARRGYRVALAEQDTVGGTCVMRGCVPEKLMTFAAKFPEACRDAVSYGWSQVQDECSQNFDWPRFIEAKEQETRRLSQVHRQALEKAGVELLRGRATFINAHTVDVGGAEVTADTILIAVGAIPVPHDVPGIQHAVTNSELFVLPEQPREMAIMGGDYIAVKLGGIMHNLGSRLTHVVPEESVLATFDQDLCEGVTDGITKRGITVLNRCKVEEIRKVEEEGGGKLLEVVVGPVGDGEIQEKEKCRTLRVDTVLDGMLRLPNIEDLGLEVAGVRVTARRCIAVDEHCRTSQSNIFAVGDCVQPSWMQFTPLAVAQGRAFADYQFGGQDGQQQESGSPSPSASPSPVVPGVRVEVIPAAVSWYPEAATVGLSDAEARARFGKDVRCYTNRVTPLEHSLLDRDDKAMIKLVVEGSSDRVVGAHMVGDRAVDIVQCLALAIRLGARKSDFDHTVGIHPSIAEEFFSVS